MTIVELTRALTDPGATIAQGYGTVRVRMKDGRTLRGFARNEGNHVLCCKRSTDGSKDGVGPT